MFNESLEMDFNWLTLNSQLQIIIGDDDEQEESEVNESENDEISEESYKFQDDDDIENEGEEDENEVLKLDDWRNERSASFESIYSANSDIDYFTIQKEEIEHEKQKFIDYEPVAKIKEKGINLLI